MTTRDPDLDEVEARLSQWGRREPRTPSALAAHRVIAGLDEAPPTRPWTRRAALATAASLVGLTIWLTLGPTTRPDPAATDLPTLPENVVLFWLDPETPVYFVTGPSEPVEKGTP